MSNFQMPKSGQVKLTLAISAGSDVLQTAVLQRKYFCLGGRGCQCMPLCPAKLVKSKRSGMTLKAPGCWACSLCPGHKPQCLVSFLPIRAKG